MRDWLTDALVKVGLPNTFVLGVLQLTDWETLCKIMLALVTIAYTLWRWRRDAKRKPNGRHIDYER